MLCNCNCPDMNGPPTDETVLDLYIWWPSQRDGAPTGPTLVLLVAWGELDGRASRSLSIQRGLLEDQLPSTLRGIIIYQFVCQLKPSSRTACQRAPCSNGPAWTATARSTCQDQRSRTTPQHWSGDEACSSPSPICGRPSSVMVAVLPASVAVSDHSPGWQAWSALGC